MRKIILFLSIVILVFTSKSEAQSKSIKDLYGKWIAIGSDGSSSLELFDNRKVILHEAEQKMTGTYKIDFTKSPIWFDLTFSIQGKKKTLIGIIRFLNEDTIEWEPVTDNKRRLKFSEEFGNSGVYTRKR